MSASSPLPPKLYFRIGEVAGLVGVEPHVLRYWEREFRSIRPTKSAKGQRVYSRRDVENLMRVRELLYAEGFTIAGAKKKLQLRGSEPAPAIGSELDGAALADPSDGRDASDDGRSTEPAVRRSHVAPSGASGSASCVATCATPSATPTVQALSDGLAHGLPRGLPHGFAPSERARVTDTRMREALSALRREVEDFLAELGG